MDQAEGGEGWTGAWLRQVLPSPSPPKGAKPYRWCRVGRRLLGIGGHVADIENNDVLRVAAISKVETVHDIVNVWHFRVDTGGPSTFPAASTMIQNYMDALYTYLTAVLSDRMVADRLSVANVTQGTVFGSIAWGSWAGGSNAGEMTALGVACLAWGRTSTPRVQIRKYCGPFTESNIVDGSWLSTVRTPCENMMAYHILQQIPAVGWSVTGCAWNRTASTYTFATSATAATEPVYQRRRRRGRGS